MAPLPDTDRFELSELHGDVAVADIETLARLTAVTREDEIMWTTMIATASKEDEERWIAKFYRDGALNSQDRRIFVAREKALGTIRAFAILQTPVVKTPEQQEKAKQVMEEYLSSLPKGANAEYARFFFSKVTASPKKYGYDSEKHFHRRGLNVDPQYQRCGLGTWLSQHCDTIADEAEATTYVIARPASLTLFKRAGYESVATEKVDLTPFGTSHESDIDIYKREPRQANISS